MSDSPPPGLPGNPPERHPEDLTPGRIEEVLAEFRSWLQDVASIPPSGPDRDGDGGPQVEEAPPDLHTLLGQFIALRHEVNLQTRAVRNQQEQNAETLRQLSQALQALRQAQNTTDQRGGPSADEQIRPLLKVLVDLYDALAPARREVERITQSVLPDLDRLAGESAAPPEAPKKSFWSRMFGGRAPEPTAPSERERQTRGAVERVRQLLGSLVTGYTMSLQRLERALGQQGLEPIRCAGQPFDPELMEVVEAVPDSGRPGGEVLDEVRRGYLWRGRVFRYAQVRVALEQKS